MTIDITGSNLPIIGVAVDPPIVLDIIGMPGSPGPEGPEGPQGVPGVDGDTGYYVYTQNVASAEWTIVHNLGFVPNVMVVDSTGRKVDGDVTVVDVDTISITFSAAFGGVAYLS